MSTYEELQILLTFALLVVAILNPLGRFFILEVLFFVPFQFALFLLQG